MLTISFGTPNGNARMAAVPMVVPAEPPRPRTPSTFPWAKRSPAIRAAPRAAASTAWPRSPVFRHGFQAGPGRGEDFLAGNVGRKMRRLQNAGVENQRVDSGLSQQVADELHFDALGVQRADQQDGHVRILRRSSGVQMVRNLL